MAPYVTLMRCALACDNTMTPSVAILEGLVALGEMYVGPDKGERLVGLSCLA